MVYWNVANNLMWRRTNYFNTYPAACFAIRLILRTTLPVRFLVFSRSKVSQFSVYYSRFFLNAREYFCGLWLIVWSLVQNVRVLKDSLTSASLLNASYSVLKNFMFLRIWKQIIASFCLLFLQILFRRPFLYNCLIFSTENVWVCTVLQQMKTSVLMFECVRYCSRWRHQS
jgi:hypothetical protein